MTTVRFAKRVSLLVILLLGLGGFGAFAQFLSGIEGTVHDSSGAVVAGAKVTITDIRLGVTRSTTTDQAGYFRFDSIAASTYSLQIQVAGFKTFHQAGLTLEVGQLRTLAPVLEVGEVSTNVTVSATAATVDLSTPTTGAVISSRTLQQTPLTGQNVYGLTALTPGMTGAAVETGGNDNYTNEYSININAAGLRQEQNGYQIDGAYTNTPSRGGGTSISPNPEIVQSMEVRTNDFDASKGRNGGATVDVFTKSGSNSVHGMIDYYFQNNSMFALNHFQSSLPASQRNEISGAIGGAIIKNKLFYFGAIDVLRSTVTNAYQDTVETQDFANWAQTNLPDSPGTVALLLAPPQHYATTNLVTVSQLEATTPGYFAPPEGIPGDLNAEGTTNINYSIPKNGYQWSVRGDYYATKNDRIYADALRTYDTSAAGSTRTAMTNPQHNYSDFANVDWTHTFSPHLLNEVGANIIRPYGDNTGTSALQIPYVNVTNLSGFGNWGPGNFTQSTLGWRDVMTAAVKTHTLKFGFEQFNIREADAQDGAFDRPTFNFNSLLDFVQGEAVTETATAVSLVTHQEAPYNRRYRALYTGLFFQDDWKVMPRLTINMGVRYDAMANFFSVISPKFTNFTFGTGSTLDEQIATGKAGFTPSDHVLDHSIWGLTPRVGFSWDVFGTGRTALRGGFGMFSDQPPYLHITDDASGNLPNYFQQSLSVYSGTQPTFQLCDPPTGFTESCPVVDTSNVTLNSSGGLINNGVLQRANLGGITPNYKLTQVLDWTLSLQQQLPYNLILEANYSASAAHHLPIYQDTNRFNDDLIVNKGTLARLNPNFGAINYGTSDGNSIGNYGSVLLSRGIAHGFALRGIYTWGKALDVYSTAQSLDAGSITSTTNIIQARDFRAQRGRADFDIRQQFSADGTWTVPDAYPNAVERNVLGGWELGGVWILQSGLPFTVYTSAAFNPVYDENGNVIGNTGGDYNADGNNYDVPDVPSFGSHLSGKHKKDFLNGLFAASDFPTPTLGQEGDLGRNTYDRPGYNNLNFTLTKFFYAPWFFGEKMRIEAKGEFINLFNRTNLNGVNSDMSSSAFGTSTSQLPARNLQFHLRASF
jgi:Carboxypeptidase regulatory-like domain